MIQIITTGGTIEGLEYDKEEDKPQYPKAKISNFLKAANVSFQYKVEEAFSKDSRFITEEDRKSLANKVELSNHNRILITHGTLTMVETARYLGKLNLDKTIVIVGSIVLGTAKKTDAPFNLGYAICSLQTLGRGVYIAMNGRIFSWNNVIKNIKENRFEANMN